MPTLGCVVFLLTLGGAVAQTSIYGGVCNYTVVDITWTCDSQALHFNSSLQELVPLNFTDFDATGYPVIHLVMDNFHGYIPNNTFVSFLQRNGTYSYTQTSIGGVYTDRAPEPSLTFKCDFTYQGFIGWSEESLTGLEWVRHLIFQNCYFYQYPEGGMKPFNNLYSFRVEGGIIHNVNTYINGFKGVNVAEVAGIPGSGLLYIEALAPPPYYWYPPGLLAPFENATTIILKDQGFRRLFPSLLYALKKMQYLEFSGQQVFYLPSTFFDQSPGLGTVHMHQVDFFCYCNGLWWVNKFAELGINWKADQICNNPNAQRGKTLSRYSAEYGCVAPPGFDNSRIPRILEAVAAVLVAVISGLVWLPLMPLWEKVLVKSIIQEWGDVPEDAEPKELEEENGELKIEVRTGDDRDREAMEQKVRAQLQAVHKPGQGLGNIVNNEANKV